MRPTPWWSRASTLAAGSGAARVRRSTSDRRAGRSLSYTHRRGTARVAANHGVWMAAGDHEHSRRRQLQALGGAATRPRDGPRVADRAPRQRATEQERDRAPLARARSRRASAACARHDRRVGGDRRGRCRHRERELGERAPASPAARGLSRARDGRGRRAAGTKSAPPVGVTRDPGCGSRQRPRAPAAARRRDGRLGVHARMRNRLGRAPVSRASPLAMSRDAQDSRRASRPSSRHPHVDQPLPHWPRAHPRDRCPGGLGRWHALHRSEAMHMHTPGSTRCGSRAPGRAR